MSLLAIDFVWLAHTSHWRYICFQLSQVEADLFRCQISRIDGHNYPEQAFQRIELDVQFNDG